MREEWVLTQDSFETLLAWLASDRETAGQKYETIRSRLIWIFYGRGLEDAETLADETINRVARKVKEIAGHYDGDPALYFYGIAQKICLEAQRRKPVAVIPSNHACQPEFDEHFEDSLLRHNCLDSCLIKLIDDDRIIVTQYYASEEQTHIDHRRNLAQRFGLTTNTLRVRAHRIRQRLQKCVQECLQKK